MLQNGRLSALVSALGTAAGEGRTVAAEHGLQPRAASTAYVSKRASAALTTLWPQTRRCATTERKMLPGHGLDRCEQAGL